MRQKRLPRSSPAPLLAALLLVSMTGCAGDPTTTSPGAAPVYSVTNPPPTLEAPPVPGMAGQGLLDWLLVGKQLVLPGLTTKVLGGREELRFAPGSLSLLTLVTIHEADPNKVLFQLGPHGILFGTPVTLNISYKGTNADPSSPNFDGSVPELLWLNPQGVWEAVPGTNDTVNRIYTAKLAHFSTYTLAKANPGNAEW